MIRYVRWTNFTLWNAKTLYWHLQPIDGLVESEITQDLAVITSVAWKNIEYIYIYIFSRFSWSSWLHVVRGLAHVYRAATRRSSLEKDEKPARDEIIFPAECTLWNSTVTPVEKGDCTLNRLSRADPNRGEAKFQFRPLNELRFRNRFRAAIRQLLFSKKNEKVLCAFPNRSLSRGKTRVQIPCLRFFTSNGHFQTTLLIRACRFKLTIFNNFVYSKN